MFVSLLLTMAVTLALFAVSPTDGDEAKYVCEIGGNVSPCEENNSYKVSCDLKMKNNGDHVVLEGSINIKEDLDEGDELKIDIVKELDNGGTDPVFTVVSTICEAMKEQDTPWYAIFETLGWGGCPIKSGEYKVDALRFDLEPLSDFMNNEYVGEYGCELKTTKQVDTTSCHRLNVAIMESEEKK